MARDLGVADHARAELAADDAEMAKLLAARQLARRVEQREPRRCPASTRRAVDLAVGEHGDVPLDVRAFSLPEDHAVDVAQLRLERMDELVPALELALQLAAARDQPR